MMRYRHDARYSDHDPNNTPEDASCALIRAATVQVTMGETYRMGMCHTKVPGKRSGLIHFLVHRF